MIKAERRVDQERRLHAPCESFLRRFAKWPRASRSRFRGCKTWRFGDAYLLCTTDATYEVLMRRPATSGRA